MCVQFMMQGSIMRPKQIGQLYIISENLKHGNTCQSVNNLIVHNTVNLVNTGPGLVSWTPGWDDLIELR